jgi:polyisoprenyl-phosphate glycosyltransferase
MKRISVVVPCFNEEEVIEETHKRLSGVLNNLTNFQCEIIYINDGSSDSTLQKLEALSKQEPNTKVLSFSRNFGHQNAVSAGLEYSSGDCTVIIDADLQDPPELIKDMVTLWEQGYEVVYAVRKYRKGETFFKLLTAKLFYRTLQYLAEVSIPLDTGDFRLIDKKVCLVLSSIKEKNKFIRGLVAWIGFKQTGIEYEREPRFKGETKYTLKKMIKFASDGILSFSKKPLKLALGLGFITTLLSFLVGVYVLYGYFVSPDSLVKGWVSTFLAILFLGGVQLICIGILGEYIARIYDEVKNRPNYIIDKKINLRENNQ